MKINQIQLEYKGWTISIISSEFVKEIAVWKGDCSEPYIINTFGIFFEGFEKTLNEAKKYIDEKENS